LPIPLLTDEGMVRKASLKELIPVVKAILSLIPVGKVTTYGSIANLLGIHPRLVGRLMALNDEPIIYPCHRVVASDGSLGGYSMGGPSVKRMLLELEGVEFDEKGRVKKEYIIDLSELFKGESHNS